MPREKACRECKRIVTGNKCDNCGSTNLTLHFSGLIVVVSPEHSEVAKLLGITKPGRYALKVE
jgi:DNA-directed RNA polymerase subunit E"